MHVVACYLHHPRSPDQGLPEIRNSEVMTSRRALAHSCRLSLNGWLNQRVVSVFETLKRYFMYGRHRNSYIVCSKDIRSIFGRKKAPAGTLGGAPSMRLCLEDAEKYILFL